MKQNIKKIVFILFTSPALVWILFHPMGLINEWLKLPIYFNSNIHSIIGSDKLAKVYEERWNAFGPQKEEALSKVYYNKGTVLVDDFFTMLTYLSPRLYFQSGDGTSFSPPKVEPVAIPLFFFWILGLISFIKKGKTKIMLITFLLGFFAYIFGQRNLAYLLPILIIYSIIAVEGISSLKSKNTQMISYILITIYGLFLLGRVFLIK